MDVNSKRFEIYHLLNRIVYMVDDDTLEKIKPSLEELSEKLGDVLNRMEVIENAVSFGDNTEK